MPTAIKGQNVKSSISPKSSGSGNKDLGGVFRGLTGKVVQKSSSSMNKKKK